MMRHRYMALVIVFILIVSLSSISSASFEISDPEYTNQIIEEINTPSIEPGEEGTLYLTVKNPYPEDENSVMENITFKVEIYHYNHLDIEKDISEVDEPPILDENGTSSMRELDELSSDESEELEFKIQSFEDTDEGVYSLRFELEFWMSGEREIMRSRGFFTQEEWYEALGDENGVDLEGLDVSGLLYDSSFEVKDPISRLPQYALGIVSTVSGILAVMFYMQEKYGYFPYLEKTFDNWSSKLQEFRSRFK